MSSKAREEIDYNLNPNWHITCKSFHTTKKGALFHRYQCRNTNFIWDSRSHRMQKTRCMILKKNAYCWNREPSTSPNCIVENLGEADMSPKLVSIQAHLAYLYFCLQYRQSRCGNTIQSSKIFRLHPKAIYSASGLQWTLHYQRPAFAQL